MQDKNTALGYLEAKKITKYFAKTFYFASLFLPKDKRLASYAVYAICRISDESVDSCQGETKSYKLNELKPRIDAAYSDAATKDSLIMAFRETTNKYSIPKEYFYELIAGMEMDIRQNRYADFKELYLYCYRVAGVVGLIMLKVLGTKHKEAEMFAQNLGIAMQLTNILRDIKEDYLRGRIYLPLEELQKFRVTEDDIAKERNSAAFTALMIFQISRARQYYDNSQAGIRMIKGLRPRFVAMAMKEMYSAILNEIERNNYNVFSRRAQVNKFKKILILIKIIVKGEYLCV